MKKVLYYLVGAIIFIIGAFALIILLSQPTEEAVHPYLTKLIALGAICAVAKIAEKLGYFDDDKEV